MRTLKFHEPTKVTYTGLTKEYINTPEPGYYESSRAVFTKYGIVVCESMNWPHNLGVSRFTVFSMILNGVRYSATLEEGEISDRCAKWMSTHFAKKIHDQIITTKAI